MSCIVGGALAGVGCDVPALAMDFGLVFDAEDGTEAVVGAGAEAGAGPETRVDVRAALPDLALGVDFAGDEDETATVLELSGFGMLVGSVGGAGFGVVVA